MHNIRKEANQSMTCREIPYSVEKIPPGEFLAITRDHGHWQVSAQVEMDPMSLPELPKPSRTPGKSQTTVC